nr:adenylyltransferase/cytidyltransferase family protein [Haliscomenobacter sp.]
MSALVQIEAKIHSWESAQAIVQQWQKQGETVVFTNGCFDLLHYGHLHYLAQARDLGHRLVLGLNSAGSVCRLKGPHRPINDELTRTWQMAALTFIDAVVVLKKIRPGNCSRFYSPIFWSKEEIMHRKPSLVPTWCWPAAGKC